MDDNINIVMGQNMMVRIPVLRCEACRMQLYTFAGIATEPCLAYEYKHPRGVILTMTAVKVRRIVRFRGNSSSVTHRQSDGSSEPANQTLLTPLTAEYHKFTVWSQWLDERRPVLLLTSHRHVRQ